MANVLEKFETSMVLSYEKGEDSNGRILKGSQRVRNISNEATADHLAQVGNAIKAIIGYETKQMVKETKELIISE